MERVKVKCKECGVKVSKSNIGKHIGSKVCLRNQSETNINKLLNKETGKYKCPHCGKEYSKNGIGTHIWRNHTKEGKNFDPGKGYKDGSRIIWNKGLTKETDERIMKDALNRSNNLKSGKTLLSGFCSKEYLDSDKHKKSSSKGGGFRIGAGKGKKGWYKGYYCDSSWELAFVIYNLEHNIKFSRNTKGFKYLFNGKQKKYYPDFILEDKTYLEIKGYDSDEWKEKLKQFNKPIKVLYKEEIQKYIDYAIKVYGKDYIDLYEQGSIPTSRTKKSY